MPALVLDRHRPTLAQVSAGWPAWARRAALAAVALVVLAVIVKVALPASGERAYVHRGDPAFNFLVSSGFKPVRAQGDEIVRFEAARGQTFLQSFSVAPLALPAYRGDLGATLPAIADAEIARLRQAYSDVQIVQEGKTRVNLIPAYSISFASRLGARRLYGRDVLVPEDKPGARTGVRLLLFATPAAGVGLATDVGIRGGTKKPYRSFRFGTERP